MSFPSDIQHYPLNPTAGELLPKYLELSLREADVPLGVERELHGKLSILRRRARSSILCELLAPQSFHLGMGGDFQL